MGFWRECDRRDVLFCHVCGELRLEGVVSVDMKLTNLPDQSWFFCLWNVQPACRARVDMEWGGAVVLVRSLVYAVWVWDAVVSQAACRMYVC